MVEVGVRELNQRTGHILRQVRERKETITITHRGRAVARIVPVEDLESKMAEGLAVLAEIDELAREIGTHWPKGVSAVEAVRGQRREL